MLSTGGRPGTDLSSRPQLLIPEGDEKRSGGTCCFLPRAPDFIRGEQKILGAPLLASCARGGCGWSEKTQTDDVPLTCRLLLKRKGGHAAASVESYGARKPALHRFS